VVSGLATAFLAGLTMLTRISVKVRLAWSTLAQMGFLLMECGLGLYTLAALHLIGHSLYKAHGFLSASMAVRQTRLQDMRGVTPILPISLVFAPLVAVTVVLIISGMSARSVWPWWWCGVLGFAWAPLLWLPVGSGNRAVIVRAMSGLGFVIGLTAIAVLVHAFAFDIRDTPKSALGFAAMLGMAALYTCLVAIQVRPTLLEACRRWSYAGFYLDEIYTRIALQSWTTRLTGNAQVAR
jgi:NAD(P)H-quinone oxidoreductase subunit 5